MGGRGDAHRTGSKEGTQSRTRPDVPTYDPARDAWRQSTGEQSSTAGGAGEQKSDRIKTAEKRITRASNDLLQAQSQAIQDRLATDSSMSERKRGEMRETLGLIKQEQRRREAEWAQSGEASADDILREVAAQGYGKPGVYDQGSHYSSGGGVFGDGSYWPR